MKRTLFSLCACLLLFSVTRAQIAPESFQTWYGNKYSMFIHFGLYSEAGGMWKGKKVEQGYSEQIQAFAPVPQAEYEAIARRFNPIHFNADSIAELAKQAGMRSIVFTTKHHDGFCMFRTATTDYNSYDGTPCRRDFVKELSEACRKAGLRFGMYFSLIDWHFPDALPISGHNADFIPDTQHEYTKTQLKELLTKYGKISELWFDMGSNTPEQSRELYELVRLLQPDCMISGRLGNDCYDFCVMSDNTYPESSLAAPWQTAASMFDETWGFRSWQERGEAVHKTREKMNSLIRVVSHGGNFLLNIGPKGDGSVVPFEAEVLKRIGHWLSRYGYAVYDTEASPFNHSFDWGSVTRKGNRLYLFSTGNYPKHGKITLNMPGYKLTGGEGKMATYLQYGDNIEITVPASAYRDSIAHVLTLTFDRKIEQLPSEPIKSMNLTAHNATPVYSYSCFDYYTNYRSRTGYNWQVDQLMLKQLELIYTEKEKGRAIDLGVNDTVYTVTLNEGKPERLPATTGIEWGKLYVCKSGSGLFDASSTTTFDLNNPPSGGKWEPTGKNEDRFACKPFSSCWVMQEINAERSQRVIMDIGAGNGIEVFLNGKLILKHLNPYRTTFRAEKLILPLQKGKNRILLRAYNRFETVNAYLLRPAKEQTVYRQDFTLPQYAEGKHHIISVKAHNPTSPHTDAELSNLRIRLRRVAL